VAIEEKIGIITHYFNKIQVGVIKITDGELKIGNTIHIKGHITDFTQKVEFMEVEGESVEIAKVGDIIGTKVSQHVHEQDEVYKVIENI